MNLTNFFTTKAKRCFYELESRASTIDEKFLREIKNIYSSVECMFNTARSSRLEFQLTR